MKGRGKEIGDERYMKRTFGVVRSDGTGLEPVAGHR